MTKDELKDVLAAYNAGVESEREACAAICNRRFLDSNNIAAHMCELDIRFRSVEKDGGDTNNLVRCAECKFWGDGRVVLHGNHLCGRVDETNKFYAEDGLLYTAPDFGCTEGEIK